MLDKIKRNKFKGWYVAPVELGGPWETLADRVNWAYQCDVLGNAKAAAYSGIAKIGKRTIYVIHPEDVARIWQAEQLAEALTDTVALYDGAYERLQREVAKAEWDGMSQSERLAACRDAGAPEDAANGTLPEEVFRHWILVCGDFR